MKKINIIGVTHASNTYELSGQMRLYSGRFVSFNGEAVKYSTLSLKLPRSEPSVQCCRKEAASVLKAIRREEKNVH
jgi:hypothetical protein